MKAVGLYKYLPTDHPESLLDLQLETPVAGGRDLLVEVKAISVNPVDYKRKAPKDLVEKAPAMLKKGVAKADADAMKKKIEAAGGKVTLK